MYYPFGLPTLLRLPQENVQEIEQVRFCHKCLKPLGVFKGSFIYNSGPCAQFAVIFIIVSSLCYAFTDVLTSHRLGLVLC